MPPRPTDPVLRSPAFRRGARRALPLAVGDVAWGLAFGALAQAAGLTLGETTVMSGLVFAGTAQLAAVGMWTRDPAALPVLGVVLTTLVVSLRSVLYGVTAAPWLTGASRHRAYAAALFLTDGSWALTAADRAGSRARDDDGGAAGAFLLGAGAVSWTSWVSGTAAGHVIGGAVRDPARWALDFAAVAAIVALLPSLWRGRADGVAWVVAGAAALAAAALLPGHAYIVVGAVAGTTAGMLADRPRRREVPRAV